MLGLFKALLTSVKGAAAHIDSQAVGAFFKTALSDKHYQKAMALNIGLPLASEIMFAHGHVTPGLLAKSLAQSIPTFLLTAHLPMAQQMAAGLLISTAPQMGNLAKMVVTGYKSTLESRTMAAIPFSYSSVSADLATSTFAYARSAMAEMGGGGRFSSAQDISIGMEAQMYSARYLQR